MAEVTAKTLGRNSLFAAMAEGWRIVSGFVLTPIIIARLGLEGYGTWTLLFSVCGYVDLFSIGFGFAYNKYTAEHDRTRRYDALSEIVSSGIALIGGISLILLCGVWVVRHWILRVLSVPEHLLEPSATALMIITLALLMRLTFGCVYHVLTGLQRLDLHHKLSVLASVLSFVIGVALLSMGHGLLALAIGHIAGMCVSLGIAWLLCRRLCPSLRVSIRRISKQGCARMLSLGGRFQLLSVLGTAVSQGVKLLISGLCGVSALAVYELADKLLALARAFSGAVIDPLMPAFAHFHAGGDETRRRRLYENGLKLVAITAVTSLCGLCVFADRLIVVWTGEAYPLAAWTIRVMAAGQFFWLLSGVGTADLRGRGTVGLEMRMSVFRTLLIVFAIVPGYLLWQFKGIVAAILLSRILSSTWFLIAFARRETGGVSVGWSRIVLRACAIGSVAVAVGAALRWKADAWLPPWPVRWQAVFEVSLWGSALVLATWITLWFSAFSPSDRKYMLERFIQRRRGALTS